MYEIKLVRQQGRSVSTAKYETKREAINAFPQFLHIMKIGKTYIIYPTENSGR